MKDLNKPSRRQFLKIGGLALVAIPVVGFSGGAVAAQNADVRKALQYQSSPKDGKSCSTCAQYQAATKGCTLYPGDTEIVPNGYCISWMAKPK